MFINFPAALLNSMLPLVMRYAVCFGHAPEVIHAWIERGRGGLGFRSPLEFPVNESEKGKTLSNSPWSEAGPTLV